MTSLPYDIVLRPSATIADQAYGVSRELAAHGSYFTLKEGEYFAHVSLYMLQLDDAGVEKVKAALQVIADTTKTLELVAKEFHQEAGYVDVEYERNATIDGLQNMAIGAANPLRDGLRKKDEERIKTADGVELENLQKYGYRSVGTEFAPHITFTRLLDGEDEITIDTELSTFSGAFESIGLFEMGDNGTCVRRIFETPLHK